MRRFIAGLQGAERVAAGIVTVLAACFLVSHYSIKPVSDPGVWYLNGIHLPEWFPTAKRAYFLPMLVWVASKIVGPHAAYLVNIPLLVALTLVMRSLARRAAPPGDGFAVALSGLLAMVLFFWAGRELLLPLCNPLRDPASFVLLGLSIVALIDYRRDPSHRLRHIVICAAAFAAAVSTRETSAIAMPALALYAVVAKLRDRHLPFVKPMLVFAAVAFLVAVPFLIQNKLVSGHFFVPAQSVKSITFKGDLVPGIRSGFAATTFPTMLKSIREAFGTPLLLAAALGPLLLWRRPGSAERWSLLLPLALIYVVFYGFYRTFVWRYVFVIALFLVPLTSATIAAVADRIMSRWLPSAFRTPAERALMALVVLAAGALFLQPPEKTRFTLSRLKKFCSHIDRTLPPDAAILAQRPYGDYLRAFEPRPADVIDFISPRLSLCDPAWGDAACEYQRRHPTLFFAGTKGDSMARMFSEFDLEPFAEVPSSKFGLADEWHANFGFYKVLPWSVTSNEVQLVAPEAGESILSFSAGTLSRQPRSLCELSVNGTLISRSPCDGMNHHLLTASEKNAPMKIRIVSDRPVPRFITARLQPASAPLVLKFSGNELTQYAARFSPSFMDRPRTYSHPTTARDGYFDAPTVAPTGAVFTINAFASLGYLARVTDNRAALETVIRIGTREAARFTLAGSNPTNVVFQTLPGEITNETTRIAFELSKVPGRPAAMLSLPGITITRRAVTAP